MICYSILAAVCCLADETSDQRSIKRLESIQAVVGQWKGTGSAEEREPFTETVAVQWTFRQADRPALAWNFSSAKGDRPPLFKSLLLWFDDAGDRPMLEAHLYGGSTAKPIRFRATTVNENHLVFDREQGKGSKEGFDRIDLKILNEGDRIVYSVHRSVGKTNRYRPWARSGLAREGTSLAAASSQPACVVTGGAGTIAVSYKGTTYHVCCEGCREAFLARPEKYIALRAKP